MNQSFLFFDQRAREAAQEAVAAKLDNVRDRALRSEAAWRGMAERAKSIEEERAKAMGAAKGPRDDEPDYQPLPDLVIEPVIPS